MLPPAKARNFRENGFAGFNLCGLLFHIHYKSINRIYNGCFFQIFVAYLAVLFFDINLIEKNGRVKFILEIFNWFHTLGNIINFVQTLVCPVEYHYQIIF